ncbi:MAG: hypothetical protein ABIU97_11155 [Dehalococcoidia bacterium]
MAIALLFNGVGVTQAQYEQVLHEVTPDNKVAAGMLSHVAGPTTDGWCVFEVWESQEAVDQFFQEKLGAAMRKANINVQPEVFQIQNTLQA